MHRSDEATKRRSDGGAGGRGTQARGRCGHHRRAGLSIVELLIALSISALLLTATMVAINASFHAYASASRAGAANAATRLVIQRVLTMVRTGTLHDAYDPDDALVTLGTPAADPVQSVGIQMVTQDGRLVKLWWAANDAYDDADVGDLWYQENSEDPEPLLERVACQRTADDDPYLFTLASRQTSQGLLLARATVDLAVHAHEDRTMSLESAATEETIVRMVGSTMPRKTMLE